MCWQAVKAVIEQSKQKGPALLLLIVIAEQINDVSAEWSPSVSLLAQRARMSRAQTYVHMSVLECAHELTITHRPGRRSTYSTPFYTRPEIQTGEEIFTRPEIQTGGSGNPDRGVRKSRQGGPEIQTQTIISSALPQNHLTIDDSSNGKKAERRPLVWKSVLDDLSKRYTEQAVKSWAAPAHLWSLGEGRWQLRCETSSQREQIISRFGESIRVALQTHLGRAVSLEILA